MNEAAYFKSKHGTSHYKLIDAHTYVHVAVAESAGEVFYRYEKTILDVSRREPFTGNDDFLLSTYEEFLEALDNYRKYNERLFEHIKKAVQAKAV